MEKNLEQYYTEFKRPPFAPTFTPTEEEFSDPISYVAKIKPEAEKFGLIKIVPPKSFRPPFCIDSTKFEFTPRVQRLNEIDALFRLRIIFINKLVKFWQIQGQQFRIPYTDNKYIDLYRLRELVEENGGHKKVNQERKWSQIAKTLGFKPNAGPSMKYHYNKWIYAFDMNTANENAALDEQPSTSTIINAKVEEKNQIEEKNSPKTRSQSRMMAGAGKKAKPIPSLDQSSIKGHRTPIESVVCAKCGSGDDEARLLLCETCDSSLHTYCTNPPMSTVPKGEWRCQKCVANALKSVSTDFGFADSNQHFNLETFGRWANTYKQQYFNQEPSMVPSEKVELEFWRNVIDIDKAVQVKYGADLISSKVGSGFPRREDTFRGIDAKEKQFYANHPWNLNNLPKLRESVLSHMNMDISGMMVPWVYVGMLFSTFCWHVEDHWTYSINYNHVGERKIWYGIPGDEAEKFDNVMKESAPELFKEQKDLLHHMTTALNPRYLIDRGVSVYTVHQNAGEFVITFPRAYHSGYNEGLNFAEAVNFAPPDWLRMGRQCLENYANVRRNCVFSHEELVMKMVSASHKMSIGMCTSTLEELSWIVAKETEFRKKLTAEGLRESQFCKFEELADDDRACAVCRTTLFSSGLVCQHEGRIVCINHFNQICEKCKVNNCCLKFRYTLEDLVPMIKRLSERTNAFFEWKKNAIELTKFVKEVENEQKIGQQKDGQQKEKIDVHKIRILADQWKNSRFPHCEEIHQMNRILAEFDHLSFNIKKILNRKIRLRDQTRCQKADTRWEHSEFLALYQQFKQSIFEDRELEIGLEEILNKREEWKKQVQKTLSDGFDGTKSIDIINQLIYQAEEEFNIRMEAEELDNLKIELGRQQWLLKAQNALELINRSIDSSEIKSKEWQKNEKLAIEEGEQTKMNLQKIRELIDNSSKWSKSCQLVHSTNKKLEELFAEGKIADDLATQFLSKSESEGTEKAEECWQTKLNAVCWIKSEAMDKFQTELEIGRQIQKNYSSLKEEAFTLRILEQLNQQCSNSLFERSGQRHKRVKELLASVNAFVERIRTIFQKAVSYYNLFEVIAGRSDLPALVEGDPLPLSHFVSSKYSDNWQQLRIFDTNTQLLAHLNAITEQQSTLLHALRLANEERPLKETCICSNDEHPISMPIGRHHHDAAKRASCSNASTSNEMDETTTTINCFICNAKFHENCALWDPFLSRLPVGLYLCPRCIRSRRPCIEDVESACSSSELPENCMEKVLVQNLVHRSTNTFTQLQRLLHAIPKGIELSTISEATKLALSEWLTMALSLEVFDAEVYKMLITSAYFDLFPIPELQKNLWQKIQKKTVNAEPLPILFPVGGGIAIHSQSSNRRISGIKRHSTTKNKRKSKEKLRKTEDEMGQMGEGNDDSLMEIDEVMGREEKSNARKKQENGDLEKCAADFCLKPYSEFTRWIQCEAGCERWYHFCCVGISVRGAQLISSYCCYKCSSAAGQPHMTNNFET